jgi:nitroreductase
MESNTKIINPVLDAIKNRHSIRAYEPKPIPKEIINAVIEAGNQAPFTSITRAQPWRFVAVENQEFKQKLLGAALPFWKQCIEPMKEKQPDIYKMATSLYDAMEEPKDVIYYNAPVILFVIGPENNPYSSVLACENVMIAAQSLGLGSCYVGFGSKVKGSAEVVQALELKDGEAIYGPILLGYPKVNPTAAVANALETMKPNKKEPITKWI